MVKVVLTRLEKFSLYELPSEVDYDIA